MMEVFFFLMDSWVFGEVFILFELDHSFNDNHLRGYTFIVLYYYHEPIDIDDLFIIIFLFRFRKVLQE